MRMRFAPIVLAGLILAGAAQAGMAQDIRIGSSLENLPDSEIDARLRFLEERLDAGRFTASAWQYGWTGIYTTTTAVSAVQAITADDGDARVVGIVGAVKSAGAVAQLLIDPLPAR